MTHDYAMCFSRAIVNRNFPVIVMSRALKSLNVKAPLGHLSETLTIQYYFRLESTSFRLGIGWE